MKKTLLIISTCILGFSGYAQNQDSFANKIIPPKANLQEARHDVLGERFEKAIRLYTEAIETEKSNRTTTKGVDGDLLAEYAYALALSHNFDYALTNIDRARMLKNKYADFYTAQVLLIMGMDSLAEAFLHTESPEWIGQEHKRLQAKYAIKKDEKNALSRTELKTAYMAMQQSQNIRAITILYRLEHDYPDAFIVPVISSSAWESLGNHQQAAVTLKKSISLIKEEDSVKNKQEYIDHLQELEKKAASSSNIQQTANKLNLRGLVYAGASWSKDMFSLNGRIGAYTNDFASASLTLGIANSEDVSSSNIGLSAYKVWGVFVGGIGVNYSKIKDKNNPESNLSMSIFSLSPSLGISIQNTDKKSSLDIMFNINIPFAEESRMHYNISIGRTIYL